MIRFNWNAKVRAIAAFAQRIPIIRGLVAERCALELVRAPISSNTEGRAIVVLVHGTWGAQSTWTKEGSSFVGSLITRWPDVVVFRFRWSGTNGIVHRQLASIELARALTELNTRYPGFDILTIGHSHGGNVIAWALAIIPCRIAGALYLNTPFIVGRDPAPDIVMGMRFLRLVLLIMSVSVGGALSYLLSVPIVALLPPRISDPVVTILCIFIIPNGILLGAQVLVPPRIRAIQQWLAHVCVQPRNVASEIVAFVVGDEASMLLGITPLLKWLGYRTFLPVILGTTALACLITYVVPNSGALSEALIRMGVLSAFGAAMAALFAITSAFGLVQAFASLDSQVTISPAPLGVAHICTISHSGGIGLRHSVVHEETTPIDAVLTLMASLVTFPVGQH